MGRLPEFVIIGAMKAGTTSLHGILDAHPDIHMPRPKAHKFFGKPANWTRGEARYRSLFDSDAALCGVARPA